MQYSRGLISPAAWRAAIKARPADACAQLSLAQALLSRAMEVEAELSAKAAEADSDEGDAGFEQIDEIVLLSECAETLSAIKNPESLSNCEALVFASTTARCATRLELLGRPRLALTLLAPAIALLDGRAAEAGYVPCGPEPSEREGGAGTPSTERVLPTAHSLRPDFVPLSEEDTAPGELFARTWPLPAVSWYYMRATLSGVAGAALVAVSDLERAIDELSHAALLSMVGTPLDYTRTSQLSESVGRQLQDLLDA